MTLHDLEETLPGLAGPARAPDASGRRLAALVRRDQLEAVRRSVLTAIPVNMLLGLASVLVAFQAGNGRAGMIWYAASTGANLLRIGLCRAACPGLALTAAMPPDMAAEASRSVEGHLRACTLAALLSGLVWAFLPLLCAGYTSPQTLFYLTITCGITAGAVTHGTAYARIPFSFILLPLLSAALCLFAVGGFDRACLAACVLLYLAALSRTAFQSEAGFREASRLKNDATTLARSRAEAQASANALVEEMRWRATHDDLTGLLNRAGFIQQAEARLNAGTACLLLLDLDGFKSVNDVYGHQTGDRVLVEVARRLRATLPPDGLAARLGGDEFAVLYDPAGAGVPYADLAAGLIAAVAQPFDGFDEARLGVSIGVHAEPEPNLMEMLSCADEALYASKAAGRNRFRLFDAGLRDCLEMRRDLERDLSHALVENALEVWFQPIYALDARTLVGLEALVRWRHPRLGWIAPPDLIAAAAMAGLTESLLRFILDQVCRMMQILRSQGLGTVRVAMNVSPREMAQIPVDEIVIGRLGALGLPPAMLEIEITEETALDLGAVQGKLQALSRAGIRVALDDFGIGYSSLSSLRQLRADRIKIDRSFVTGLSASDDKRGLVLAVLGLGNLLGLEVVAEGVESQEDLQTLQAMGCPFLQGYHLGRPMPVSTLEATLFANRTQAA
ncbi:putative bifunctional diguanylate cyclase/phosphodiesterase [Methylobacterium sp. E-066]|uniref:putative bifunctional diguanylate cyclase/phosphodiesterase n=1 Tax=Methylobacterium sp. E-066 TaxID=2836584 RepID=UPI001FBBE48D|nr:EAL domain-containing protein [Methylobacterium sp. E-066]MCJ2139191.1 EAL domain-containing protein [Methylobacterium sp. E-066]